MRVILHALLDLYLHLHPTHVVFICGVHLCVQCGAEMVNMLHEPNMCLYNREMFTRDAVLNMFQEMHLQV